METFVVNVFIFIFSSAKAPLQKQATVTKQKSKPPLKKQFSSLSVHSHRLSLAGDSIDGSEIFEEHDKAFEAPLMKIFGLNKPEWVYNLIGKLQNLELTISIEYLIKIIIIRLKDASQQQ